MPIFQKSVLNSFKQDEQKVALRFGEYLKYKAKSDAIKSFKEEEYQDGFLKEIFENCLDYTLKTTNPNAYNLARETKNETDGKKADGAIYVNGEVVGVIELKDSKTKNLDTIEPQAFNYHNSHKNSKYIVISNFDELRFYIDKKTAYESFSLFNLSYDDFKKLHLILSYESIKQNLPLTLKEKSNSFEAEITNNLYKDYKALRSALFNNLCKNNETIEKIELLKATQKLLDRLVFIFFAEDSGLIPTNSIAKIIEIHNSNWKYEPLYEYYKIYFEAIDKGNERTGIRLGYNGELFKQDVFLDSLKIDDFVLNEFALKISGYNFKSDVSVNILGHIFENSLTELEELKADLENSDFDKKKTKRKKDGIFYTPEYITKYIVDSTLGVLCHEYKATHKLETKEDLDSYRKWLLDLKIIDPACGSGAFLNQALEHLIKEHNFLNTLYHDIAQNNKKNITLLDYDYQEAFILQNNLYGVDINEEAVEIAKLSLWLRTAECDKKLVNLSDKIVCANSLLNMPFDEGSFDVVIGNPPYVRVQGLKSNYEEESKLYEAKYKSATGNYDIYALFLETSFKMLTQNGKLSYILPHKFLISDFGVGIREFLSQNKAVESLLHFGSEMVFSEASTYTCIITLSHNNKALKFKALSPKDIFNHFYYDSISYEKLSSDKWNLSNNEVTQILEKIKKQPLRVKDAFAKIFQGIATSGDDIYLLLKTKDGLYSKALDKVVEVEDELLKPTLKGEDISRYAKLENRYFVIFPYILEDGKAKPMSENYIKENYPKGYEYLKANEDFLRGRESGKMNKDGWFLYIYPKSLTDFEQEKIITPEIANKSQMSLDSGKLYHNTKCYSFIKRDSVVEDYRFYLTILNSSLMWFFLKNTGYELRGGYFVYKTAYLEPFPLPKLKNIEEQKPFIAKADLMLELNAKLQTAKQNFLNELKIDKLSLKLQNFEVLEFDDFIAEYAKAKKIKLIDKLAERNLKNEWLAIFENDKKEVLKIKEQIVKTDKEIDSMVYKLYNLSDDEIGIVKMAKC